MENTQVDLEVLQYFSRRFEQESIEISELHAKTRQLVYDLQNYWSGKGADSFFDEMYNITLPAMHRLSEALSDTALKANKIAGLFKEAQQEAADKFRFSRNPPHDPR